jgi:hypothetical protein
MHEQLKHEMTKRSATQIREKMATDDNEMEMADQDSVV